MDQQPAFALLFGNEPIWIDAAQGVPNGCADSGQPFLDGADRSPQ